MDNPHIPYVMGIIICLLILCAGYGFVRVSNSDIAQRKCDSEWYLKIIGFLTMIVNFIAICYIGYLCYQKNAQ
jgi:hypothetical protein